MLLSSLLYFRAVKAQRYLEPALATVKTRINFAKKIEQFLEKEFNTSNVDGIKFSTNALSISKSLIFRSIEGDERYDSLLMKRLSNIFFSLLTDEETSTFIDMILIETRLPYSPHLKVNKETRVKYQHEAESILDYIFEVGPDLEQQFGQYFAVTIIPTASLRRINWVDFRIILGEHQHIEMIRGLGKYLR
jgi:hypothetical protein